MKIQIIVSAVLCLFLCSGCDGATKMAIDSSKNSESITTKSIVSTVTTAQQTTVSQTTSTTKKTTTTTKRKTNPKPTTTTTKRTTTTTKDNSADYWYEIEEEERRHEEALDQIQDTYERRIEDKEDYIENRRDDLERQYGSKPYESEYSLQQQITQLMNKIALLSRDTSGIYARDIAEARRELSELEMTQRAIRLWEMFEDEEAEAEAAIRNYERQYEDEIDEENELYESNIIDINIKYGR